MNQQLCKEDELCECYVRYPKQESECGPEPQGTGSRYILPQR